MKYGYARVSSVGQDLTIQVQTLKNAGCDVVREEKVSGTSLNGRTELQTLMEFMRDGDELVVTRIDRLARSIRDLQNLVHDLKQRGVTLSATEQPIDTKTSAGKAFLDMLGVFSEFETNLRKERQMEGVRKAKEKGVYRGRGRTIDASQIFELKQNGYGATKISKELGITRQSVYRLLKEQTVQSVSVSHWWLLTLCKSVSVINSGDLVTVSKSISCIQKSIGNQMVLNRLRFF